MRGARQDHGDAEQHPEHGGADQSRPAMGPEPIPGEDAGAAEDHPEQDQDDKDQGTVEPVSERPAGGRIADVALDVPRRQHEVEREDDRVDDPGGEEAGDEVGHGASLVGGSGVGAPAAPGVVAAGEGGVAGAGVAGAAPAVGARSAVLPAMMEMALRRGSRRLMKALATRLTMPGDDHRPPAEGRQRLLHHFLRIESARRVLSGCRPRVARRAHRAGAAGDDVDALVLQFVPQALRQHPIEGLAGRIGSDVGRTLVPGQRGHEDDAAAAAFGHIRQQTPDQGDRGPDVHRRHPQQIIKRGRGELADRGIGRVVNDEADFQPGASVLQTLQEALLAEIPVQARGPPQRVRCADPARARRQVPSAAQQAPGSVPSERGHGHTRRLAPRRRPQSRPRDHSARRIPARTEQTSFVFSKSSVFGA